MMQNIHQEFSAHSSVLISSHLKCAQKSGHVTSLRLKISPLFLKRKKNDIYLFTSVVCFGAVCWDLMALSPAYRSEPCTLLRRGDEECVLASGQAALVCRTKQEGAVTLGHASCLLSVSLLPPLSHLHTHTFTHTHTHFLTLDNKGNLD